MKKQEFLRKLSEKLEGLPYEDVSSSLSYYEEMILDRIEDGIPEEEAVSAVGNPEDIATEILSGIPLGKLLKKIKKNVSWNKRKAWETVLIVLGSPIWLSLLAAALVVFISVYAVIWSLAVSYLAVTVSFAAIGAAGIILFFPVLFMSGIPAGLIHLGIGIFALGLAMLLFFATKPVMRGALFISKKIVIGIKLCFIKGVRK